MSQGYYLLAWRKQLYSPPLGRSKRSNRKLSTCGPQVYSLQSLWEAGVVPGLRYLVKYSFLFGARRGFTGWRSSLKLSWVQLDDQKVIEVWCLDFMKSLDSVNNRLVTRKTQTFEIQGLQVPGFSDYMTNTFFYVRRGKVHGYSRHQAEYQNCRYHPVFIVDANKILPHFWNHSFLEMTEFCGRRVVGCLAARRPKLLALPGG